MHGTEGEGTLILGVLLLVGYGAHVLGARIHVPRVTLLLALGALAGPGLLDVVPRSVESWFGPVAHMALAMVGFLLGESFLGRGLRSSGRVVLWVSIAETVFASGVVFCALLAVGTSPIMALLLAGIAPASAPAATIDVVREKRARGPLTQMLLRVVALDDVWGVMLFGVLLCLAEAMAGGETFLVEIGQALWQIAGAVGLGVVMGVPMAWLTGRLRKGEPHLLEAMGFVFVTAGLATALNVSYLLSCIVLGAVVANLARHHTRPFRDIRGASQPFLALFFVLAGYEFDITVFAQLGLVGAVYVIARSTGKIFGGRWGARWGGASPVIQRHLGYCLLPQAGVALGLALYCVERLPEYGSKILPLVIATSILFELFGPILTVRQLRLTGEIAASETQKTE